MGITSTRSLETETLHDFVNDSKSDLLFEVHNDDTIINMHAHRIAPLYDDEIGLWEELEHRNRIKDVSTK